MAYVKFTTTNTSLHTCSFVQLFILLLFWFTVDGHWGSWSPWSSCSVTCEKGVQLRNRSCDHPAPMYNGTNCTGTDQESKPCDTGKNCPRTFFVVVFIVFKYDFFLFMSLLEEMYRFVSSSLIYLLFLQPKYRVILFLPLKS